MKNKANISLIGNGSLFGFPANLGIAKVDRNLLIAGVLDTKGKRLEELIQNEEMGISYLSDQLTVIPKSCSDFSALFAKKSDDYVFLLQHQGIVCGIAIGKQSKQLALLLNTVDIKNGNKFEQFISSVANWAKIDSICIIARDKSDDKGLSFLNKIGNAATRIPNIPKNYEKFQLIAIGVFDLTKNEFGKNLYTLTKLNQLQFAVGGSFTDQSFGARLAAGRIESESFIIQDLSFEILKSQSGFKCIASGTFVFKLENSRLGFTLCGAASNASFTLSASPTPDTRIALNSRLSFSDLGLSIGVNRGSLSFGMIGRLNTFKLSMFAGIVVTPMAPTRISLLTAAFTSTTGRISLKDIITEIADIQWDQVDCLDVISIGDFDLTESSLPKEIDNFPTDNTDENYEKRKKDIEQRVVKEFNNAMEDAVLHIDSENGQLSPLGNDTNQFILTDRGTMRHYRIDDKGKISLNCQIYVCYEDNLKIGAYDMPMGFFICGTLEIFNVKTRFLFLINKGESLIALVQISKIEIHNIFTLTKSDKDLPIAPINGGIAQQLIKPSDDGAVMYMSIQKGKGEIIFYLDAKVSLLNIFSFDALVLLKNRFVYINIEFVYWGFKVILHLEGKYDGFSNAGFNATIGFDTSVFLNLLDKSQKALKDAAKAVRGTIEDANRKLSDAQQRIRELKNEIGSYDNRINQCRRERDQAKWYQFHIKVARECEILKLEVLKIATEGFLTIAYEVLQLVKEVLDLGGRAVGAVLRQLSNLIENVTQLLWIKSFELAITANSSTKEVEAKLDLVILGKEIDSIKGKLKLSELEGDIKNFVANKLNVETNALIDKIKNKKFLAASYSNLQIDISEYDNLSGFKEKHAMLSDLYDSMENLFLDTNDAYYNAFDENNTNALELACQLTQIHFEEEMLYNQYSRTCDSEFVESLEEVIKVIREENINNLADFPSSEKEKEMEELLGLVKYISSTEILKNAKNKESLFARLDRDMQNNRRKNNFKTVKLRTNATEANKIYADSLSELVNLNLGDKTDEMAIELKNQLYESIEEFRLRSSEEK